METASPQIVPAAIAVGDALRAGGTIALAMLAAGALLPPPRRARAWSMLGALVLAPVLLGMEVWDSPQVAGLRDRPALAAGALLAALAVLALLAALFHRRPRAFALAAVAALPFRLPIELGGSTANLLLPLYVVIAAGALAWALPALRRGANPAGHDRPVGMLEWLLAVAVVLYAVQSAYSSGAGRALEQVVFFYAPFTLLFARLRDVDWTPRLLGRSLGVLTGLALAFAAIGYVEYATGHLLLNPKVIASNQIEEYFRVNSLFFDPNIYGRFLVVVMLGITAVLIWSTSTRVVLGATAALAVLAGGLLLTLSQSSLVALLIGLAVLALARWRARWTLLAAGVAATVAAVLVLAVPQAVGVDITDASSLDDATSGRASLIAGGLELAERRPVAGWGSGSFQTEYRKLESASDARATAASHTIPITVAAEQGLIGLALYLALLAAALVRLLPRRRVQAARAAVFAAFAALVAHTWMYAAFLEDPATWALLGVGSALALGTARRSTTDARDLAAAFSFGRGPAGGGVGDDPSPPSASPRDGPAGAAAGRPPRPVREGTSGVKRSPGGAGRGADPPAAGPSPDGGESSPSPRE